VNARLPAELADLSWWNAAHLRTLRDIDETRAAHRLTTAARTEIIWLIRTGLGSTGRASGLPTWRGSDWPAGAPEPGGARRRVGYLSVDGADNRTTTKVDLLFWQR
jgi:hypothetical protein